MRIIPKKTKVRNTVWKCYTMADVLVALMIFSVMLQSAGLPKVTVHSLRHTNITLQIMQGVPLVTVSKRAGHARSSTTSDVYAYFFQSTDRFAADCLDGIFSS